MDYTTEMQYVMCVRVGGCVRAGGWACARACRDKSTPT